MGNRPSRGGGERCVAAQRTESVGGTISRARTMENLTIVASRTIIQARRSTGLFLPMATPADTRAQQRPFDRAIETAAQPAVTATAQSLCPLSAWRGQGKILPTWGQFRVLGIIPEPGGLQEQTATGEEPETGCLGQRGRRTIAGTTYSTAGVSTSALSAILPSPVGDVQQTTVDTIPDRGFDPYQRGAPMSSAEWGSIGEGPDACRRREVTSGGPTGVEARDGRLPLRGRVQGQAYQVLHQQGSSSPRHGRRW